MEEVKRMFKPEFLNRIDEIVMFNSLDSSVVRKIIDKFIGQLVHRLQDKKITISLTDQAYQMIQEEGFDPIYGARPLKRFIQSQIETKLAKEIIKGNEYINQYKVLVSQTSAEHAGEPGKDGSFRILTSSMRVLEPGDVCTHSYLLAGAFPTRDEAENLLGYLKTKFVRFLILQALSSIHLTKTTFSFVPVQDFSKSWTDVELYEKYGLTEEEIAFIESMIKPME